MKDNVLSFTSVHRLDSIVEKLAYNFELVEHRSCSVTFVNDVHISLTIKIKDDPLASRLLRLLTGVEIGRREPCASKERPDCADP